MFAALKGSRFYFYLNAIKSFFLNAYDKKYTLSFHGHLSEGSFNEYHMELPLDAPCMNRRINLQDFKKSIIVTKTTNTSKSLQVLPYKYHIKTLGVGANIGLTGDLYIPHAAWHMYLL